MNYNGKVRVAIGAEKGLVDAQKLKSCIEKAFQMILKAACDTFIPYSPKIIFFVEQFWWLGLAIGFKCYNVSNVTEADARAILMGIQLAGNRGLSPLYVESDSLNEVNLCSGDTTVRSTVFNLFDTGARLSKEAVEGYVDYRDRLVLRSRFGG
ncbi:hypothetical protein ACOSQ3_002369 [Xanthoceras sorbifolium]